MMRSKHILRSWTIWANAFMVGGVWGLSYLSMLPSREAWIVTVLAGVNIILRLVTTRAIHLY